MPRNTNVKLSHCNQFVTFLRQPWKYIALLGRQWIRYRRYDIRKKQEEQRERERERERERILLCEMQTSLCLNPS
jgi:hypothetical protein